jgi:deoxyribodipyrimidine photo-lyase
MVGSEVSIVWFRRDLRLADHPALAAARARGPVAALFVIDPALVRGRFASPRRTWFLLGCLATLARDLADRGSRLIVRYGRPVDVLPALAREVGASAVFVSRDHGPYGRVRDRQVAKALAGMGRSFHESAGLLVHEPEVILSDAGRPYAVFAPFLRRWESTSLRPVLATPDRIPGPTGLADVASLGDGAPVTGLEALGLADLPADPSSLPTPGEAAARRRLETWLTSGPANGPTAYATTRDRPADPRATSRLGPDLRFGLLSPVEVVTRTLASSGGSTGARRFISQLAWRDFYAHALWHDPRLARWPARPGSGEADPPGRSLERPPGEDDAAVDAWRVGRTGYPIVDAAMRQLAMTGFMPNRARMIVASFLTKDLLVDWRVGEAHFMHELLDGDPASNLGGWRWAASVGIDGQPWFRVFNPVTQGQRFDPDGIYVRQWLPELARVPAARIQAPWTMSADEQAAAGCRIGVDYPAPIVDHAEARQRALDWFRAHRRSG